MSDIPSGSQGFTFTPPALVLNGQPVAGGLNFTATNAVDQVDMASQAYSFISNLNTQAFQFAQNAFSGVFNFAGPQFSSITSGLSTNFGQVANALNTAASNIGGGFLGNLF